jgi:hypothetical protein
MYVLGSWALVNIGTGFAFASQTQGEAKYFWLMNSYWNFVNLGIAGLALVSLRHAENRSWDLASNVVGQRSIEKIYVFNAGLDLAYMAGGLFLHEHGEGKGVSDEADKFKGYGKSIVFQGSILLVMDIVMYYLHHRNTKILDNRIRQMHWGVGPGAVSFRVSF